MPKIIAKDCSPFEIEKNEQKQKIYADEKNAASTAIASLVINRDKNQRGTNRDFFVLSDKNDDHEDKIAELRFDRYNTPNEENDNRQCWCAGRYIGVAKIGNYEVEICPRFGIEMLNVMLKDVEHIKERESETAQSDDKTNFESIIKKVLGVIWISKFSKANKYGLPRKVVKR